MNTREEWLTNATTILSDSFKAQGHELPPIRVSVGWPHGGSAHTIGQCWPGASAADGVGHIFISPVMSDPIEILAVLVHELVHAVNHKNGDHGHGKEFSAIAKPLGLVGKMTSTTAGDALREELTELAGKLGEFPHGALIASSKPKGSSERSGKSIKLECAGGEDFQVSISKTRLSMFGAPKCPCHDEPMQPA